MKQSLHLIAGLGITGHSIARYLQRRNIPFIVFDTRKEPTDLNHFYQEFPGIDIFLEKLPASIYPQLHTVIASPGVPLQAAAMLEIRHLGVPITGDIECLAREIKKPVVAITGTNGKSTVTTLVGEMAKVAGLSVAVAGNIGLPVLDLLDDGNNYDLWVLELSSFQLDLIDSLTPLAASILNVTADHLDRHLTVENYIAAKQRIYRHAKTVIYNRADAATKSNDSSSLMSSFGLDFPADNNWGIHNEQGENYLACGEKLLMNVKDMRLRGLHNWQNALAACALAECVGVKFAAMKQVLENFSGLPHRCQWVRTLEGVEWINDSKGTNVGATIAAISGIGDSIDGKIVLIAGGLGKNADFKALIPAVSANVCHVIVLGEDANNIREALIDHVPVSRVSSLEEAIIFAHQHTKRPNVVLLSPACASQDMFRDFNHRGEVFTQRVNLL